MEIHIKNKLIGVAVLGLIVSSCATVKVIEKDAAEGFRLSEYKTFAFYPIELNGDTLGEPYNERVKVIEEEISRQLIRRKLEEKEKNPDLMVNIGIVIEEKTQTRPTTYGVDGPVYMGQRRYTWKSTEVVTGKYKQGTVAVDLVDTKKNKLVWNGVVSGIIPKKTSRLRKDIAKGMEELFKDIPLQ